MTFSVQLPLNSLSFGQVSFNLLYEFYKMGLNPCIFKASDHQIDYSAYNFDQDFIDWISKKRGPLHMYLLLYAVLCPCIHLLNLNIIN